MEDLEFNKYDFILTNREYKYILTSKASGLNGILERFYNIIVLADLVDYEKAEVEPLLDLITKIQNKLRRGKIILSRVKDKDYIDLIEKQMLINRIELVLKKYQWGWINFYRMFLQNKVAVNSFLNICRYSDRRMPKQLASELKLILNNLEKGVIANG